MKIKVRLFGELREFLPQQRKGSIFDCQVEVERGSKVSDVIKKLGLPTDRPKVILINGRAFPEDKIGEKMLEESDILSIFPYIVGG